MQAEKAAKAGRGHHHTGTAGCLDPPRTKATPSVQLATVRLQASFMTEEQTERS